MPDFLSYSALLSLSIFTPGPVLLLLIGMVAERGRRVIIPAIISNSLATGAIFLIAHLGLAVSPIFFSMVAIVIISKMLADEFRKGVSSNIRDGISAPMAIALLALGNPKNYAIIGAAYTILNDGSVHALLTAVLVFWLLSAASFIAYGGLAQLEVVQNAPAGLLRAIRLAVYGVLFAYSLGNAYSLL